MKKKKLPPYVLMTKDGKTGTHMRLQEKEFDEPQEYWRDAGAWGTQFKMLSDGSLVTTGFSGDLASLNGIPLIPCTKAAWKKSNQGYV